MKRHRYLFAFVLLLLSHPASWAETLSIYHIDVGQGDATLIVSPTGKTLLMDGGNTGKGIGKVIPLIQSLNIRSLDYTVASHYDADHIGGLDEVINVLGGRINVQAFDRGKVKKATKAYDQYWEAVKNKHKEIKPGDRIDLGPGIEIICVAVNQDVIGGRKVDPKIEDENGNSVALLVRFKDFDYFLGGDLTGGGKSGSKRTPDVESLVAEVIGDVDVLRLSHHGSQTSSNETFLNMLRPKVTAISVGNGGSNHSHYHHPSRPVLDRLRTLPMLQAVYVTNRGETTGGLKAAELKLLKIVNGNIVLKTDGTSYEVNGRVFRTDGVRSFMNGGSDGRGEETKRTGSRRNR